MTGKKNTIQNRFPTGLHQPEGSFRFSADALLLACFPRPEGGAAALDLGTGCGVVALALGLCRPDLRVAGVEIIPELAEAARRNANRLGMADRFRVFRADVGAPDLFAPLSLPAGGDATHSVEKPTAGAFDLALVNPPYRQRDRGRLPANPLRRDALFEVPGTLAAFCAAAATALRPGGAFCLVYPYARLADALRETARHGLRPARLKLVQPREHAPPSLVLMESRKERATADGPEEEPPLVLHERDSSRFTKQALDFCPFLSPADNA